MPQNKSLTLCKLKYVNKLGNYKLDQLECEHHQSTTHAIQVFVHIWHNGGGLHRIHLMCLGETNSASQWSASQSRSPAARCLWRRSPSLYSFAFPRPAASLASWSETGRNADYQMHQHTTLILQNKPTTVCGKCSLLTNFIHTQHGNMVMRQNATWQLHDAG